MSDGLDITNAGDSFLRNLEKKLSNIEELTRKISEDYFRIVQGHFERESGFEGKWQPLAPSTIKQRMKKGYFGLEKGTPFGINIGNKIVGGRTQILQRTGLLASSIQPFSDKMTAGVGTNMSYAGVHEYGGIISRSNLGAYLKREKYKRDYDDIDSILGIKKAKRIKKPASTKTWQIRIPRRSFLRLSQPEKEELGNAIIEFLNS